MRRVLVITNNLEQASYRLRVEALRAPLAGRGFDLDVQVRPRGWLARRALLRSADGYHAVILQRKLLDPSDARLLRRRARRVLFDVDDAVMYGGPGRSRRLAQWRNWRRFKATARAVDHVVAGNGYLAEIFRQQGGAPAATVVPTVVDPARYRPKVHQPTGVLGLVWIGSGSTLPYLQEIVPVLEEAALRLPGLRLITIADRPLRKVKLPVEHIPWSEAGEPDALLRGDIGIAPTPTDRWTLGKCGFKIVQYMAAGLPVIASPVGANGEIVLNRQTGFLPADRRGWVDAILTLSNLLYLRREMGRTGRERVEKEYSVARAADAWAALLSQ